MTVTKGLQRLWLAGLALLVVGLLLTWLAVSGLTFLPGALVLAVAAGRTAALGPSATTPWRVAAWAVPTLSTLLALAPLAYLLTPPLDGHVLLLVVLLVYGLGLASFFVWMTFGIAALVEIALLRRRFGDPGIAWKNGETLPTPPESTP